MKRSDVDVMTLEPRDVLMGGPMVLGRPETNGHLVMVVTEDGVSEWPRGTYVTVVKWYDGLSALDGEHMDLREEGGPDV